MTLPKYLLLLSLMACNRHTEAPPPRDLGEPVGAMVEAHGARPAFYVAYALERGVDAVQAIERVTSAAATGMDHCFRAGESAHLEGWVREGRIALATASESGDLARCVGQALNGAEVLPGRAQETAFAVEVRLQP